MIYKVLGSYFLKFTVQLTRSKVYLHNITHEWSSRFHRKHLQPRVIPFRTPLPAIPRHCRPPGVAQGRHGAGRAQQTRSAGCCSVPTGQSHLPWRVCGTRLPTSHTFSSCFSQLPYFSFPSSLYNYVSLLHVKVLIWMSLLYTNVSKYFFSLQSFNLLKSLPAVYFLLPASSSFVCLIFFPSRHFVTILDTRAHPASAANGSNIWISEWKLYLFQDFLMEPLSI